MFFGKYGKVYLQLRLTRYKSYVGTKGHVFIKFIFQPFNWIDMTINEDKVLRLASYLTEV
jgi:hypothetical protein